MFHNSYICFFVCAPQFRNVRHTSFIKPFNSFQVLTDTCLVQRLATLKKKISSKYVLKKFPKNLIRACLLSELLKNFFNLGNALPSFTDKPFYHQKHLTNEIFADIGKSQSSTKDYLRIDMCFK